MPKYKEAATYIQKVIRGFLARKKISEALVDVSHVVIVKLNSATDLNSNNDIFTSKPDTYAIVNIVKNESKKMECVSAAKSNTQTNTNDPNWSETLQLALSGTGLVAINVFSKHLVTDTLIGQIVVNLSDLPNFNTGCVYEFTMDLASPKIPIYDLSGALMSNANDEPSGTLSFSMHAPSMFRNMCGWFWDIKYSFFNTISGEKMWVVLTDGFIYCYDSPFKGLLQHVVECSKITMLEEVTYKLETTIEGLTLNLADGSKFVWGWGDEAKKVKGLWRRALCAHLN